MKEPPKTRPNALKAAVYVAIAIVGVALVEQQFGRSLAVLALPYSEFRTLLKEQQNCVSSCCP